jgi:hypothetical protein
MMRRGGYLSHCWIGRTVGWCIRTESKPSRVSDASPHESVERIHHASLFNDHDQGLDRHEPQTSSRRVKGENQYAAQLSYI